MKKVYQTPNTKLVKIASKLMLNVVSTEAASDAAAMGRRGGDSFWDDEEE